MTTRFVRPTFAAVLAAGLLAGCSSGSGRVPVAGAVTVDGAPGALAVVTFWPADPGSSESAGRVVADADGKFVIGDKEKDTGLTPGEYKVTVSRFVDRAGKPAHGGGKKSEAGLDAPAYESVQEAFLGRETTPLAAKVARGGAPFAFEVAANKKQR